MKIEFKKTIILMIIVLVSMANFSCKKTEEMGRGKSIYIQRMPNPDEVLNALMNTIKPSLWKNFQDKNVEITATDKYHLCLAIGARSANTLLNVYLENTDKAEELAKAIKKGAMSLNIKSQGIEAAVKSLNQAIKSTGKEKNIIIKIALNQLHNEITETISRMGDEKKAVLIKFGAWIESMRQISSILEKNYNKSASTLLYREIEMDHFKSTFEKINGKDQLFKEIIELIEKLDAELVIKNDSIGKKSVKKVKILTSSFCSKYIK
jgi:hypothetical protein